MLKTRALVYVPASDPAASEQFLVALARVRARGLVCDHARDIYREGRGRHQARLLFWRVKWDSDVGAVYWIGGRMPEAFPALCERCGAELVRCEREREAA